MFEAEIKSQSSYASRGIYQGTKLLSYGIKFVVGTSKQIHVWRDPWLPTHPPRPPKGPGAAKYPHMKISELLNQNNWNVQLLDQLLDPEDVSHIKHIRPSITGIEDMISWMYTSHGKYSLKYGYQQLRNKPHDHTTTPSPNLFPTIWSLNLPPKIKHFWWKSLHDTLPTGENLKRRKIVSDDMYIQCGEAQENTNHLLYQCRVSKEIWEQNPAAPISGTSWTNNSLVHNIALMLGLTTKQRKEVSLFPFIGWRIWKMRNELLFNNKRWSIPDSINKALLDYQQWQESLNIHRHDIDQKEQHKDNNIIKSLWDVLSKAQDYCCFVDASWLSLTDYAGIGWVLYDKNANIILKGTASIPPTTTLIEAEVEALRSTIVQLRNLGYKGVLFCGDPSTIYKNITIQDPKEEMK